MSKPPVPLRQWLPERTQQLADKYPSRTTYRTLEAALEILDRHCSTCESYDQKLERCSKVTGCSKEANFRHSLVTKKGRCPDNKW
jgi:hypothetical protein